MNNVQIIAVSALAGYVIVQSMDTTLDLGAFVLLGAIAIGAWYFIGKTDDERESYSEIGGYIV